MYYSQFSQDQIVNERYIKNRRGGVFVDVGAHNGILYNNSYFFEKELGWSGICIEPMREEFEKLQKVRSSININACAFSRDGVVQFRKVEDKQSQYAHSYNMLSGVVGQHSTNVRVEKFGLHSDLIDVPCVQLKTVFKQNKISVVDYLSIDTEGSELEVLKGIDFESVRINIIDFEHNGVREILSGAEEILGRKGFEVAENIQCDILYVNKNIKWSWDK